MKSKKYLLDLVLRKGNCLFNLAQFLKTDNGENFMKVSNLIPQNANLKIAIEKNYFPLNFSSISFPGYLSNLNLSKILLWYCSQIKTYGDRIEEYIKHKESFERFVLTKQYDKAIDVLAKVEKTCGMSLWLIESYCLLEEFGERKNSFIERLDDIASNYYYLFRGKCNTKEPSFSYRKRIKESLDESKIIKESQTHYSYRLFLNQPNTDTEWKWVLIAEGMYSLIDIYNTTVSCLQHYFSINLNNKKTIFKSCYKILRDLPCPECQIMHNILFESNENIPNEEDYSEFIDAFDKNDHEKVVEMFFSNDSKLYNSFSAYRFVATSMLILNQEPEKTDGLISNEIIQLIFNILRKREIEEIKYSIERLSVLARSLHSFSIHKGICIFLNVVSNSNGYYSIYQQYNSFGDVNLISYELSSNNKTLIPYKCIYCKQSEDYISIVEEVLSEQSQENYTYNYYKEAYYRMKIIDNIKKHNFSTASMFLVESYIDNMFLLYTMNTDKVCENIHNKISNSTPLTIEELCYVFIDNDFSEYKRDCFLNFLDDNNYNDPLQITQSTFNNKFILYYLQSICSKNMLSKIYWLFDSAEGVNEYRIKICNYLLDLDTYRNNRELKSEVEDLTKNLELKKRLRDVEKSSVSVDIRDIYKNTYDDIDSQVKIFNSISPFSYLKMDEKENIFYISNPRQYLLEEMYLIYAKAFCFSSSGIDTSLSTRVRHGSLSNQVLRTLTDNNLSYDVCECNSFFSSLIKSNDVSEDINTHLHNFNISFNDKLEYIRQHTLKVFIDKPIEDAVFNYSLSQTDISYLLGLFGNAEEINTEEMISALNKILLTKTNSFLAIIKKDVLPNLLNLLTEECDKFYEAIDACIKKASARRSINKKITDCKVALNSEINTISEWFSLNDSDNWENFSFDDLIDMCSEIEKKLFSGFEAISITKSKDDDFIFNGKAFRQCIDIILMLFNNAIQHSGFIGQLNKLKINFSVKSDNHSVYLIVENNLSDVIDKKSLNSTIDEINNNYSKGKYLIINTRQEGGMGLLKVMLILFSATRLRDQFYVSLQENKFRVEIKIKKEIVLYDKNSDS